MLCEQCGGVGYLADANPPQFCPGCCGVGVSYCCEGAPPRMATFLDDHIAGPGCWCGPYEDEPGVWVHRDAPRH